MAYEHLITPDWHDTDVFTDSEASRSTNNPRTGSYSFEHSSTEQTILSVDSAATKGFGFGWYVTTEHATNARMELRESTTVHVSVHANTIDGRIDVKRGGSTLLGSSANGSISTNQNFYISGLVTIHDTTGSVVIYIDGDEVINESNIDTKNGGTGVIDNMHWYSTFGMVYYIDDIKVTTDAAPGMGGLYVQLPNADGSTNGWTPSAGDEYECVDEAPPTFTDYISTDAGTVNTLSTFTHAGLSLSAYDSIPCVAVAGFAQLDASGAGTVRMVLDSNGTESDGTSTTLSTSGQYIHHFVEQDPDTSAAWTKAGVDAVEFGVETI